MRHIPSMIVQRKTDQRRLEEYKQRQMIHEDDTDPRKGQSRSFGQYDQCRVCPLIEDEE
jgi:hypothetical protein